MYSFASLAITAVISLLVGGALGALLVYSLRQHLFGQDIEQRLHKAESDLQGYQRDVAEHFAQTAGLVNNLTHAYRDMHEHLANGALKLATPAISRQLIDSASGVAGAATGATYLGEQAIEPPRDWAPKVAGSKGTLSEDYGLRDDDHTAGSVSIATETAEDFDDKPTRY